MWYNFDVGFNIYGFLNKVSSTKQDMHKYIKHGVLPTRLMHANGSNSKFNKADFDICDGAVKIRGMGDRDSEIAITHSGSPGDLILLTTINYSTI